jgi:hypothetical protein
LKSAIEKINLVKEPKNTNNEDQTSTRCLEIKRITIEVKIPPTKRVKL